MEELEKKIEYQFIPAPLNLFYVCDVYTYSLLLALIQKESYWKLKDKLSSDGYFFMSIEEISDIIYLFDRGDIRCTIEALYINGIIDVKCNGIGRGSKNKIANEFKINYDKIKEFDEMSIFDIKEFNVRIEKLKRGTKVTYDTTCSEEPCKRARKKVNTKSVQDSTQQSTQQSTQDSTQVSTQIASNVATTTIYNIEEKEKIENLNKIDNIDSNISNIVEIEKTVETDDKIEMIDNTSNGTADAITSNKAPVSTKNEKTTDTSTDDNLLDTIFADETIEDNDSNSSTYKTENDMMRDEDKKAINEYKIAKKLLTNDERSAILKLIFDNLKTIPKEDANKVLTEYKFSKKEIDYVNECYANQYSYAS